METINSLNHVRNVSAIYKASMLHHFFKRLTEQIHFHGSQLKGATAQVFRATLRMVSISFLNQFLFSTLDSFTIQDRAEDY